MPQALSPDAAGRHRVRRLAHAVRALSLLGAVILLLVPPLFWSRPGRVAEVAHKTWGLGLIQLDAGSRWMGLAGSSLQAIPGIWVSAEIWLLFGCYASGELLALRPARHLHRLGLALVTLAAAGPVSDTLVILALTWGNPVGQRELVFNVAFEHYLTLLFGLVLLALATVLREAARVATENAEFV